MVQFNTISECIGGGKEIGCTVISTGTPPFNKLVNVTGPPGALLFDRDQRSH